MKYFGHQVNASQDVRLRRLRKASGSLGIDLYWRCLELVGDKLTPKNTSCKLEYSLEELADEVDSTIEAVKQALETMVTLEMCHKVPQSATIDDYFFPKLIKYADKAFRNAFNGVKLDELYESMCHIVPHCAPTVQNSTRRTPKAVKLIRQRLEYLQSLKLENLTDEQKMEVEAESLRCKEKLSTLGN